jgi:hypothetical protein
MTEVLSRIPEAMTRWKPEGKRRPQTMEDIDKTAELQASLRESLERYWEKQAWKAEAEQPKITVFGLFLGLLGAILTAGTESVIEELQKEGL